MCNFFIGGDTLLHQEVMSIAQMVNDANAMSEDMDKQVSFVIQLVSPQARGIENGRTEVRSYKLPKNILVKVVD